MQRYKDRACRIEENQFLRSEFHTPRIFDTFVKQSRVPTYAHSAPVGRPSPQSLSMRSLILLAFLELSAFAQEGAKRFDPVVFLGTLKIQQDWAETTVARPPHTVHFFRDTLLMYNSPVGFSMVTRDTNAGGWTMTLDYDGDRYGAMKLVRVSGYRPVPDSIAAEQFARLAHWVDVVLAKKLMERKDVSPNNVIWTWIPRSAYHLSIRTGKDAHGEGVLSMELKHE